MSQAVTRVLDLRRAIWETHGAGPRWYVYRVPYRIMPWLPTPVTMGQTIVNRLGHMLITTALVMTSQVASPANYYVATNGDDAWSGKTVVPNVARTDGPFATLSHAVEATRASPGADRIVVKQATHYLGKSILLDARDSGLVIEGESRDAIITGGRRITGWRPWKGSILQADLATLALPDLKFRELYYGATLQRWARVPNFDPQHPRTGGFLQNTGIVERNTKTKFRYREGDLHPDRWAHPGSAWIMFHDSKNYETQYCPVKRIDAQNRVVEALRGVYVLSVGNPFYLCGILEELDAPGEWCMDPDAKVLYFWPPTGAPSLNDQVIVPALSSAFVIQGKPADGKWVESVRISGLALRDFRGQAITMTGAKSCVVSRCDLRNAEVGVYLGDDTHACQVRGCDITQTQGDGVSIIGTSMDHERVSNHVVDNCYIWDFGWGRIHNRCGGVYMHRCARCKLTHNHVHDSPRYGLAMDVGNDCEFAYNYCHHVNLVTTDSGIIEAATAHDWRFPIEQQRQRHRPHNWGNKVHHNLLHDSGGWHTSASGELEFPSFTWGIYLDVDCCGWHIHDNVCYNTVLGGFMLNAGTDNVVENNVFVDGTKHQIQWNPWRGYAMRDNHCERNVFSYAGKGANLYALNAFKPEYVRFGSNLVHSRDGSVRIRGVRKLPRRDPWSAWQKLGQDQGSLLTDPLFVNADKRDYRLRSESPAFNLGINAIDLSSVGNYASPDRRTWPRPEAKVARDTASYDPAAVPKPSQPALRTYEDYALGEKERGAHVGQEGDLAIVAVTNETAASGKQSLKFVERPGVKHSFVPYCTYMLEMDSGVLRAGFDLRWEKGALFVYEWRDDPYYFSLGPHLAVDAEGHLKANNQPIMTLVPGQWVRFDLTCGLGPQSTGTYDLTVRPANGNTKVLKGIAHAKGFNALVCIVVMSMTQGESHFYLDNVDFRPASGP